MSAIGSNCFGGGLVFTTRTVVVSLAVGTGITLLASLRPALRDRLPPILAVREGAILRPRAWPASGTRPPR